MKFLIVSMYGGWRWILRDGVEVVARGQVLDTPEDARKDAKQFMASMAAAVIVSERKSDAD